MYLVLDLSSIMAACKMLTMNLYFCNNRPVAVKLQVDIFLIKSIFISIHNALMESMTIITSL